jgi:hypothetical protein
MPRKEIEKRAEVRAQNKEYGSVIQVDILHPQLERDGSVAV